MKENKYDEEKFFQEYSRFPRSVKGLSAAGEWHELKKILPDFQGKRVLDIGCGFGWHCIYAAEHGAKYVLGTDISEKMLEQARKKTDSKSVVYKQAAMEDLSFNKESFDVIISSLAFHYTPDFNKICENIFQFLAEGGEFIFSVEHPVFTSYGTQEWYMDETGRRLHWPVDNYFKEGAREAVFLGEKVVKYHKTLTTYMNALLDAGFCITGFKEPQPEGGLIGSVAGMKDELRRPMMAIFAARKGVSV